jgi:hypothetical protein
MQSGDPSEWETLAPSLSLPTKPPQQCRVLFRHLLASLQTLRRTSQQVAYARVQILGASGLAHDRFEEERRCVLGVDGLGRRRGKSPIISERGPGVSPYDELVTLARCVASQNANPHSQWSQRSPKASRFPSPQRSPNGDILPTARDT